MWLDCEHCLHVGHRGVDALVACQQARDAVLESG
jgi:hypothetical protein